MSEVRASPCRMSGEGLTEAEIVRWHVRPGDVVTVNQMIVEIETAKASVELPCPFAGTVTELLVAEGSIVPVGSPIISVETPDAPPAAERQAVLVGYGVREGAASHDGADVATSSRQPTGHARRPRRPGRSRRCASSPATSVSTWTRCRRRARTARSPARTSGGGIRRRTGRRRGPRP